MTRPVLVADWGTTNLRAWVLDGKHQVAVARFFPDLGVGRLAPGEAARRFREEVRPALGAEGLPALLAGMVGSTLGWREAPYLDGPVDATALAGALVAVEGETPTVRIVPGLRSRRPDMDAPDVMRGEEVQLLGWLAAAPEHARGCRLVCLPGTHAKWARIEDGRVQGFVTTVSGELFDLLSTQSALRAPVSEPGPAGDEAFALGLAAAGEGEALASRLFTARSRVVGGGGLPADMARAYMSGLLIGADVAACPRLMGFAPDTPTALVGSPSLTALYASALERRGAKVKVMDGAAAALTGLRALITAMGEAAWT